jgi:hypothetical protein
MNTSISRFACIVATVFAVLSARTIVGQVAPAGLTVIQSPAGVYYVLYSDSVQPNRSQFFYLNYATQQFDSIVPNVSASGAFSGTSPSTGRTLTDQIQTTSISLTYNSVGKSGPKESLYGPTRQFAGQWRGTGIGLVEVFGVGSAVGY